MKLVNMSRNSFKNLLFDLRQLIIGNIRSYLSTFKIFSLAKRSFFAVHNLDYWVFKILFPDVNESIVNG